MENTMQARSTVRRRRRMHDRKGVAMLWTILMLPVLTLSLIFIIEGTHLWVARAELENALEAAALAAVTEWAESGVSPGPGWTLDARLVGLEYASINPIDLS